MSMQWPPAWGVKLTHWRGTMARHFCMVPGCKESGRHMITLRARRPDTSAIWAPSTGAYLCDRHATTGCEIDIIVRPKRNGKVLTKTWGVDKSQVGVEHVNQVDITQGPNRVYE